MSFNLSILNGIPYRIDRLNDKGNNYVIWDLNDDEKVSELLAHVEQKASCNDSPPSISFPTQKQTGHFIDLLKEEEIPYKVIEKTTQKGVETFIEYGWKDYARVRRLIRKTVVETQY